MSRVVSTRQLVLVWIALLTLLGISAAGSFLNLGIGNLALSLTIAALKIALIAACFMHLRHADQAVRLAAGAALFFLVVLAFLSFGDFLTRPMHPAPWRAP